MNIKKILCVVMSLIFVSLFGCTDNLDNAGGASPNTDLTTTATDMSAFLGKEYTASDKLSSDIDSYQVQIYDTVFTFPFYYDELIADGWVLDEYEDPDEELDSYYERHINFKKGYVNVSFIMYNPDVTIRNIKDCVISGFSSFNLDYDYLDLPSPVFIPGGHQMDAAKLDEVLSGYREPDREDVIESHTHIEYKKDDIFTCARLSFDENGIIYSYYTDNPVEPEGYTVSDAVHVENDYKKPTELGDEITDMTVIFDGDLYALPVPVSAFIDNGWQIVGESPTVSGGNTDYIELKRGNDTIEFYIRNPYDVAIKAEDTFIEDLSSTDLPYRENGEEIFEVSGGFKLGMAEEEFLKLIKKSGLSYELPEDEDDWYDITIDDGSEFEIRINVRNNVVRIIYIQMDIENMVNEGLYARIY